MAAFKKSVAEEPGMTYNQTLAERIRSQLGSSDEIKEKKMFGGLGFIVNGNMACGIIGDDLVVRIGAEHYTQALSQPHTRPFDFSGKPMAGWIYVEPVGYEADRELKNWIQQGMKFARSLPPK